jgi:hypothetical protein
MVITRAAAPLPGEVFTAVSPLTEGFCWANAGAAQASAAAVAMRSVRIEGSLSKMKQR